MKNKNPHCNNRDNNSYIQHNDHHKMMIQDFKNRFWVSLILTLPILLLSPMVQNFFLYEFYFTGSNYVLFILSTIIFLYGGWPFLKGLYNELKTKNPGMMTLIGIAITTAYIYSSAIVFGVTGKMFFWELVTLIDIMLLGHWIEMKSILGASRSLELLIQIMPSTAHLIKNGVIKDVKLVSLKVGDIALIKPGEKIPADGTIIEGTSYVNESFITGEAKPIKKQVRHNVIGGSLNGNSSLKVKIQHTGQDSYLSKVINLVKESQKSKSQNQLIATIAAKWLTFTALSVGFITLIIWLYLDKDFAFALERMVTVMIISCPHALGLAIPLVVPYQRLMDY